VQWDGGAGAILLAAVWTVLVVVNLLKGKYGFALIALALVGLAAWIEAVIPLPGVLPAVGAIRLAKPGSPWARRYDKADAIESMRRFPKAADKEDPNWMSALERDAERPLIEDPDQWPSEHPGLWDKTTPKTYEKQYGYPPSGR